MEGDGEGQVGRRDRRMRERERKGLGRVGRRREGWRILEGGCDAGKERGIKKVKRG